LSADYSVPYAQTHETHSALYYPTTVDGEDLSALVANNEIPTANDYGYRIQWELMGLRPFDGAKQIFEVDFGETEQQRVCGISGNPIRLGWNLLGNTWQNCFLVPFIPPRSPQWMVMHHEMAHNFTWASQAFSQGLGIFVYSEGVATALALADIESMLGDPTTYPVGPEATTSLEQQRTMWSGTASDSFQDWLSSGADFSALTPDIVDGIWLHFKGQGPEDFARRFFLPLRPEFYSRLSGLLANLSQNDRHTVFAALVSAALGEDVSGAFASSFHYPINQGLFNLAYAEFAQIVVESTHSVYLPVVLK
jgi:hypothetical protein